MEINEKLDGYKPYEEMNDAEKAQVNSIVEQYKRGQLNNDYCGITDNDIDGFINSRLDLEHLHNINEKINENEASKNLEANLMRMQLFEDRWKKGFYKNNPSESHQHDDSMEVKELKDEVSSLKNDIKDLKELLISKLK